MQRVDDTDAGRLVERRVVIRGALAMALVGGCAVEAGSVAQELATPTPEPTPEHREPASGPVAAAEPAVGLGAPRPIGTPLEVTKAIRAAGGFLHRPDLRAWLVEYPAEFVEAAKEVYPVPVHEGLEIGLLALFQKCPHRGCRVPECLTSGQFECPCHSSQYTRYGEYVSGPSPRGLDLFPISVEDGQVIVTTSGVVEGLRRGTDVTGWQIAGPSCIDG